MRIVMATSEVVPFSKTGGLADVCGSLPVALSEWGHDVVIVTPAYACARRAGQPLDDTGIELSIPIGAKTVTGRILRSTLPNSRVSVLLIEQPEYFGRAALYGENGQDYVDNCERFVFFSRSVMEAIRLLELNPDVLHCHDWQAGLVPAYHQIEYRALPGFDQLVTVFTIHNMAYQGQFWHWDMLLTGLDWKYFNWRQMEFYGHLNLLKTGLVFSDAITAVSPRYAREIQTQEFGCGLEGVLQQRREVLSGIINGVDYTQWDPGRDPHITKTYDVATVESGKALCKAALQREMGLAPAPRTPLVATVGRLAEQKGVDLIASIIEKWSDADVQWVILGDGEPRYRQLLQQLAARAPKQVAVRLGFDNALAHRIEAGADIFLMPSRYEPCGLNQLYSLRYGTVPVVREVGGLADTITDTSDDTLASGRATGFIVSQHSVAALGQTLRRALDSYGQPDTWRALQENGMRQDWSWRRSAQDYLALYRRTLDRTHQHQTAGQR